MKTNKQQLGLLYMCVLKTIDSYTKEMIIKDGVVYAQLNLLLSEVEKEERK